MTETVQERVGICSWSLRPEGPDDLIAKLGEAGLNRVQLALRPLRDNPAIWGDAPAKLAAAGVQIVSGMFGTEGENYSNLETIRRTGGLVPDETWEANWNIVQDIAPLAVSVGVPAVSFHAGFIPHDREDPTYGKLLSRMRQVADRFAQDGINLLLETGQETAADLNAFLDELDRPSVGVNFDPANMILYAKGDPIEALRQLLPRVRQVHLKDATQTQVPGTWGKEVALGDGEVDWAAFVATLKAGGNTSPMVIERERGDAQERLRDIQQAVQRIAALL